MANASNSNMNIPNTFNLTGTWQNNVEPLNNINNRQTGLRQQTNRSDTTENVSSYLPVNNNTSSNITSNNSETPNLNQSRVQTQAMPINQNQVPLNSQMLSQDINTNRTGINQATALNSNVDQNNINNNINFQDLQTLANFVKTQIGKNATIEFLIGENSLIEKTGTIVSVGENYVLLNESSTRNLIACDLRGIKFIYFEY